MFEPPGVVTGGSPSGGFVFSTLGETVNLQSRSLFEDCIFLGRPTDKDGVVRKKAVLPIWLFERLLEYAQIEEPYLTQWVIEHEEEE